MNPYEEYAQRGYFKEPHTVMYCTCCECCITAGDEYYAVNGEAYCETCFDEYLSDLKHDARQYAE